MAPVRSTSPARILSGQTFLLACLVLAGFLPPGAFSQTAKDLTAAPSIGAAIAASPPAVAPSLPDAPAPQTPAEPSQVPEPVAAVTLRETPLNILKDQGAIWTSPVRLRERDLRWIVPLGLAATVAITTDHQAMSSVVSRDTQFNHANVVASNVLLGGFIAAPGVLFSKGQLLNAPRAREAGILGGEALVDGFVVEQGLKLIFWRERPLLDDSKGKFFQGSAGNVGSSFPSGHSVLAWSSAAVLAEEYPAWWQQAGIYSLAAGVSATRVLGQKHFPSDVLVGSAAGWLIGHYVSRKHHRFRPSS